MKINEYIERDIEKEIIKWLGSREILAVRGPRQSGKTTLLFRLIDMLKNKGTDEKNIHFISMEDDFEKEKFEKNPKEYIEYYLEDKGHHVFFFDEIQYIKNAGKILKLLFDTYKIKIIVTGSSSLDLNQLGKYLVGRVLFFDLFPFSFKEFLKAKDEPIYRHYLKHSFSVTKRKFIKSIYLDKLNKYFNEYLTFGGYPRIVMEKSIEKKKILLRNLFITYIEKDIVGLYGIKYRQKIIDLVKYLASVMGSMIKYEDICSVTGLYYKELKEILSLLEDTYIIRIIKPFHKNLVTEIKKNPKIYFIDIGLRNMIINRFEFLNEEYGILLECFVSNLFRIDINYWRTTAKAEVDFILKEKVIPIEVKLTPKITRSLRSFVEQYNPKLVVMANMEKYRETKINKTKVLFVPACVIENM